VSSGPPQPPASPGFLMWRVTLQWKREVVAALVPLELTHVQFVLLASTWWAGEKLDQLPSQRTLADYAGTDPMMTSQVVRALEKRGLVQRTADPADARSRLIAVTLAGADLAPRAIEVVEAVDRAFFAPVPTRDLLTTLGSLDRR
jgi:DNA-binding MarR family transcriptional regulator